MNENELTLEEKWEQAGISNNFIFYKIMRNNKNICKRLLEILLSMEIDYIEMQQEEEINIDFESKGVRLDVYAKNQKNAFNIEMQAINTKELPKRARYYQGVMDVDLLKSGQHYESLRSSYIIFICLDDIFNCGLPVYTFENLCKENNSLPLGDRAYKYFFIAKNCDKINDDEQRAFLKLVASNKVTSNFSKELESLVKAAKHNVQWRKQYMDLEREKLYARDEGIAIGEERKSIEDAVLLVKKYKISPEQAAKDLEAPLEKVLEKLKDNSN
ncbi:MAG: Rpn family recombination-promoting nuclease/putative transposase [Treponema sp.]|nr:Rpn family recombination-promoting nuclease/putative transposase [Treponema sp.]